MRRAVLTVAVASLVAGCQPAGQKSAVEALTLSSNSMAQRQQQMRRYDSSDEGMILSAAAAVMQDLGFGIDETSSKAGLLVGSKTRDAIEGQQVAASIFLAALAAAAGAKNIDPRWDQFQKIRISITTKPSRETPGTVVRVTFQRIIWNNLNQVSRVETVDDTVIYREFFDKLSQAVFLEGQEI